jgi:hypothetical protein
VVSRESLESSSHETCCSMSVRALRSRARKLCSGVAPFNPGRESWVLSLEVETYGIAALLALGG